jgi:hypothetical protein
MPRKLNIRPGDSWNRLTALERVVSVTGRVSVWKFRCECGTVKNIPAHRVVAGVIRSCGCFARERMATARRTHGHSGSPEYKAWASMHCRCRVNKQRNYAWYGGKGVTVCERWSGRDGFASFLNDMGTKPDKTWSIDRINPDIGYEPHNCRWIPLTDNIKRAMADKKLRYLARTHCRRGHEFTPENSYYRDNGCRICKECNRMYSQTSKARKKAQTRTITK